MTTQVAKCHPVKILIKEQQAIKEYLQYNDTFSQLLLRGFLQLLVDTPGCSQSYLWTHQVVLRVTCGHTRLFLELLVDTPGCSQSYLWTHQVILRALVDTPGHSQSYLWTHQVVLRVTCGHSRVFLELLVDTPGRCILYFTQARSN